MSGEQPRRRIVTIPLIVADYNEAIAWYTERLGFRLFEDTDLGGSKRWVTIGPAEGGVRLLLAQPKNAQERSRVGDQTGGRVFLFLETDDFTRAHSAMLSRGVEFKEAPRHEAYGTVAVFADLYGNLWDLLEPKRQSSH